MSSKSSKPSKKLSVPREMDAIQSEYTRLCGNAGQVQYQILQYQKELTRINDNIENVNREAAARQALDAQKPKEETKTEENQVA